MDLQEVTLIEYLQREQVRLKKISDFWGLKFTHKMKNSPTAKLISDQNEEKIRIKNVLIEIMISESSAYQENMADLFAEIFGKPDSQSAPSES